MKPIDFEKYKFKLRSLPNSKTYSKYFEAFMSYLVVLAFYNFVAICLFYDDFMPRLPALFVVAIPVTFLYVYASIERGYRNVNRETVKDVIVHIRLKQHQSLKEKLEDNPEILKERYDKKSLIYWAKKYNNIQAHSLLIKEMKKNRY